MVEATVLERPVGRVRLFRLGIALALGVLIPALGLPQAVTGPLVNALLLLTVEGVGVGGALIVGMVTPLSALVRGVLPLPLLVMVPFIALGNGLLVSIYGVLRDRSRWVGLVAGAVVKFLWLYGMVTWLVLRPLEVMVGQEVYAAKLPETVASMMQWPQLATALAGGLLAFGMMRLARRAR